MKKLIIGLVVGIVLGAPVGVKAWGASTNPPPMPKPIYQFNAAGNGYMKNEVAVFDDQDNKCYITYDRDGAHSSISCVKVNR